MIAVAATVLLIVSAAIAGIFFMAPRDDSASASFIHAQPGAVSWDQRTPLTALLIGAAAAGQPAGSLTVVSLNPGTRSVRMLSIPPNLWVTIPGLGQSRIGDAYADGGPRLAVLAVESMTHVPIPYYVAGTNGALRSLLDAAGGITVRVPRSIRVPHHPSVGSAGFVNIRIRRGLQHMNGATALDYAQVSTRQTGGHEGALQRQRQVLQALEHRLLTAQNVFQIPTIVNSLGGSFATNFPYDEVPALAGILGHVPQSRIRGTQLDFANQAVTSYAGNHTDVLVPDWYHVRRVARQLFPEPALVSRPGVIVLNGSGVVGQAASLSTWLSLGGIRVANYATAPAVVSRTRIDVTRNASPGERRLAAALSALLQAPLVSRGVAAGKAPVIITIGRDYQDLTEQ